MQVGNVSTVVCTFNGVPCSIHVYENDRIAIKEYNKAIAVHWDILKQQQGYGGQMKEAVHDKSRVKTSCSGLPHCMFEDGYGIAVVRGPVYTELRKSMPYVAVNYDDGQLRIVGFEAYDAALDIYKRILNSHKDSPCLQESHDGIYQAFSTDEISVAVGDAEIVPRGGRCELV